MNKRVMDQISKIPEIRKILWWDNILSKNEVALELYEVAEKLVKNPQRIIKQMCGEPRSVLILGSDNSELAATYLALNKGVKLSSENLIPPMFYPLLDQGHFLVYSEGINPELKDIFVEDIPCLAEVLDKHEIDHVWAAMVSQKDFQFVRTSKHLYQW